MEMTFSTTQRVGEIVAAFPGAAHYAYLKRELPLLAGFVTKIDRVHGQRHPELSELQQLFQRFRAEMEAHLPAEEEELFPLIRDRAKAVATLERLEAEHQEAGRLLGQMREVTHGYRLPPDACGTYMVTYQKLAELEADTLTHIHLENNILFPRLREQA
jgi:regulator of cell morphogenesis and NO signaling